MPYRRFEWHEHIKDVEGEYKAVRIAIDRLKAQLVATPDIIKASNETRKYLRAADSNLEGTYMIRLFAAFEAALRSYMRAWKGNLTRNEVASILIDIIGGRGARRISSPVRDGAHAVRRVRNFWAHEHDSEPEPMTIAAARARLERYLSCLPEDWG